MQNAQSGSMAKHTDLCSPVTFFKCLSDDNRLKVLMLISAVQEACVCDLQHALDIDQPKLSRNLSFLRKYEIVKDYRRGKWVFYRLHPALPAWACQTIRSAYENNTKYIEQSLTRLNLSLQRACCDV